MLIRFSVENFLSFKERVEFSMAAGKGTKLDEHVMNINGKRVLKSGIIFGANASGKSNLIEAISFSSKIILNDLTKINSLNKHFKLSKDSYNKPGIFQYDILINKKTYNYGFALSYSQNLIISEWLYSDNKCLFERNYKDGKTTIVTKENLNPIDKKRFYVYRKDFENSDIERFGKVLFLSDIAKRQNKAESSGLFSSVKNVFEFFRKIIVIFPDSKYNLGLLSGSEKIRLLLEKYLTIFDTGIQKLELEDVDFEQVIKTTNEDESEKLKVELSNVIKDTPIPLRIRDQMISVYKDEVGNIKFSKITSDHGGDNNFEYREESDGTKRLFDLIPILSYADEGRLIIIDEIDRSLHTVLTKKFLEIFFELSNNNSVQLIATTHETALLDLNIIRQDEIWFIERNKINSSEIFSLNDFQERYDDPVGKRYLLGKYGAIPVFKSEEE